MVIDSFPCVKFDYLSPLHTFLFKDFIKYIQNTCQRGSTAPVHIYCSQLDDIHQPAYLQSAKYSFLM